MHRHVSRSRRDCKYGHISFDIRKIMLMVILLALTLGFFLFLYILKLNINLKSSFLLVLESKLEALEMSNDDGLQLIHLCIWPVT